MTPFYFLNVNKPLGHTSHDVVAAVRRMLRERGMKHVKVGHAGTLDPLATGVLVVCVGAATRLSEYVMGHDKTYRAKIRLGVETSTYDAEGEVVSTADASEVTDAQISSALKRFTGNIEQIPPMYSAIKQGGKKLYDLARAGQVVERAAREVRIESITLRGVERSRAAEAIVDCDVRCSAGTYIRSIAHDLGEALGVGGSLVGLVRTASGAFRVEDAVTLEQLREITDWTTVGVAPLDGLYDFPRIQLTAEQWDDVSHGRGIDSGGEDGVTVCATEHGRLCAILHAESGQWLPHKVFLSSEIE